MVAKPLRPPRPQLLEKLEGLAMSGERLRTLRVVELLEDIGTPEARDVLKSLAQGAPEAA